MAESKNNITTMIIGTVKSEVRKLVRKYYNADTLNRWTDEAVQVFLERNEKKIEDTIKEIYKQYNFDDKTEFDEEKDAGMIIELVDTIEMCLVSPLENECISCLDLLGVYRFVKSRIITGISERYNMDCYDDTISNFLKRNEKGIHSACMNIIQRDGDEVYNDDYDFDSKIIEIYNSLRNC